MDTERCIATEVLDRLSAAEAWEYRVIPCAFRGKVLVCYGEEGRDYTQVMEELEVLTGNTLVVEPMAPEEFRRLIHRCYRKTGREATKQFVAGHSGFLYDLIDDAYRNYASDIHFEPYEHICRVRFRIDGQLIERHVIEKGNYASVVNQIKILANLDISEKRLPHFLSPRRSPFRCAGFRVAGYPRRKGGVASVDPPCRIAGIGQLRVRYASVEGLLRGGP